MNSHDTEICGFLDVKIMRNRNIVQKVRKKSLISSKVWKRVWCSMKILKNELGVQIQFDNKFSCTSSALKQRKKENSLMIPPSAIVHRIPSKTKQFAFSISSEKGRKSLLTLSANSETETQRWMTNIRYLLNPKKHYCMEKSYNISIVDNIHSKAAGLTGLYGNLITSETGIYIKSLHTDKIIETFKWKEFGQFHLRTTGRPEDVKRICVIHTTKEFRCGIGELHIFCLDANTLLQDLVTQGRGPKHKLSFIFNDNTYKMPIKYSEVIDSLQQRCNTQYILNIESDCKGIENVYELESSNFMYNKELNTHNCEDSNTSIASEIYEEIVDNVFSQSKTNTPGLYENTDEILYNLQMKPPPLPPRHKSEHVEEIRINVKQYPHSEISHENEKSLQSTKMCVQKTTFVDNSNYVPMSPQLENFDICKLDTMDNTREDHYAIMQ